MKFVIKDFLIRCGDIEVNPGPVDPKKQQLTISHWNLNGIAANNFAKISLLEAYNAVHDFDVTCISETFLDSSYSNDDDDDVRLDLNGYNLSRSDCSVKYTDFTCTWYVTCYYVNILVSCFMKNSVEGPHMLTNVIFYSITLYYL